MYLDADDDIATVRERLNRTEASRITLVVPTKSRVFQNLVNLKLLERYSTQYGVDVTLVTGDPATRDLARGLKLRLRGSLAGGDVAVSDAGPTVGPRIAPEGIVPAGAQPGAALRRRGARSLGLETLRLRRPLDRAAAPRQGALTSVGKVAGYLLLVTLILLAGAGVVLALPEATIRVTPATTTLTQVIAVRASTDYRSADLAKGQLPARLVQATVEDAAQADSTGKKQEPAQKAAGSVRFTNRSGAELTVPSGTVVRTGMGTPLRFFTTAAATVPAGSFVQVPVVAEQAGSDGNVPAWSINQVDGSLSFQVSVLNDAPMSGGTEKQAQLVTASDRQQLRDALYARLKTASIEALRKDAQPGALLLTDQIAIRVEEESFDHEAGEVSKSFGLRMRLTASVLTVAADGLNRLAENAIEAATPAGATVVPGSITLGAPGEVRIDGNTMTFRAEAQAKAVAGLDLGQLRRDVQGQTPEQARLTLTKRYRLASDPTIILQNAWLGRLPLLGMRIRVDVLR